MLALKALRFGCFHSWETWKHEEEGSVGETQVKHARKQQDGIKRHLIFLIIASNIYGKRLVKPMKWLKFSGETGLEII